MAKKNFYAVAAGKKPGIYQSWEHCKAQTHGFKAARFKGFGTRAEAEAYIASNTVSSSTAKCTTPSIVKSTIDCKPDRERANRAETAVESSSIEPTIDHVELCRGAKKARLVENGTLVRTINLKVHFDGGSRGNPGLAGSGAELVVTEDNEQVEVIEMRKYLALPCSNNVAEYEGLLLGLAEAKTRAVLMLKKMTTLESDKTVSAVTVNLKLDVFGDSMLIIKQMIGAYACKSDNIRPCYEKAKRLEREWMSLHEETFLACTPKGTCLEIVVNCNVKFEHVYRKDNKIADRLANEAMDQKRSWTTIREISNTDQKDTRKGHQEKAIDLTLEDV